MGKKTIKVKKKPNRLQAKPVKDKRVTVLQICALIESIIVLGIVMFGAVRISEAYGFNSWKALDSNLGVHELQLYDDAKFVTLDEYVEGRYQRAVSSVDGMLECGLISKGDHDHLLDGLNSDYFYDTCVIQYENYQSEAAAFFQVCALLEETEYNFEEIDGDPSASGEDAAKRIARTEKLSEIAEWVEHPEDEEDCVFVEYLRSYVRESDWDKYKVAHEHFHKAIEVQAETYQIPDNQIKYYAELELLTNFDYIDKLEVDVRRLTMKNMKLSNAELNWLVRSEEGKLFTSARTLTLDNKDALKYFDLTKDAGLYDDFIAEKVTDVVYLLGDQLESSDGSAGLVMLDITGIEDYASYIDEKRKEMNERKNVKSTSRFTPITISERYEGEQMFLLYDIKTCVHKVNTPSIEEIATDEWKDKLAHQLVTDSLMTELFEIIKDAGASE